jgi:hypothetical protein
VSERLPPLPEDLEQLLQADQEVREPAGAKDRVLARLRERLPLDEAEDVSIQPPSRTTRPWLTRWLARAAAGGAMGIAKLAIAFAAGTAVTIAVNAAVQHVRETRRLRERTEIHRPSVPPTVTPPEGEAPPPPAPTSAPPAPPMEAPPGTAVPVPQPPPPMNTPRGARREKEDAPQRRAVSVEERTLLEDARQALQRGDTTTALEMLTRHEKAFPDSALSEEREALMVREALRAGSYDQARAWLRRMKEHYPDSPLLPVLEAAMRDIDEPH